MAENFPEVVTLGEGVPNDQIEAFYRGGKRLFGGAKKRFSLSNRVNVGSTDAAVLDHVRYRVKTENPLEVSELVTILDSAAAIQTDESVSSSIAVTIETPLPWSLDLPNTYIRETFHFPGFGAPLAYDYSIGVSEYTLEGGPVSPRTLDDAKSIYPRETADFQSECTPEHFTNQLLTLVQLSPDDEVGCEPNPYRQIYTG